MTEDIIAEVGIDGDGRLYVKPSTQSFDYIYRAAMEVHWDPSNRRLFSPRPREWSYVQWFAQILAAVANEYGFRLVLAPSTLWSNIPDLVRSEVENLK